MKKHQLRSIYPVLKTLAVTDKKYQGNVIKHMSDEVCTGFYECVHNLLFNSAFSDKTKSHLRKCLRKHKNTLRYLAKKNGSKRLKRQKLQRGGLPIGLILGTVLPLLANILFKKKKK